MVNMAAQSIPSTAFCKLALERPLEFAASYIDVFLARAVHCPGPRRPALSRKSLAQHQGLGSTILRSPQPSSAGWQIAMARELRRLPFVLAVRVGSRAPLQLRSNLPRFTIMCFWSAVFRQF